MGRRYSRVSNYSIGQTVRAIVFFLLGAGLALMILPGTGWLRSQQEVQVAAVVIGLVLATLAKRHT